MWVKATLVLALAAGVTPAFAGSDGSALRAPTRAERDAWLGQRATLAKNLPDAAEYRQLDSVEYSAYLMSAGDLDGDGAGDLIDVRSHVQYDSDLEVMVENVRLEAYRGKDGKALWTRDLAPGSWVFPVATKVGLTGKAGVVVLTYSEVSNGAVVAYGGPGTMNVAAYDGAGLPLWTLDLGTAWAETMTGYGDESGFVDVFLDAVSGPATDMVITMQSSAIVWDPTYAGATATRFVLVDGATGTPRPLGAPITGEWSWVDAFNGGDLDGDKLEDVVIGVEDGDGASLHARSSANGTDLWSMEGYVAEGAMVTHRSLGDVTGDGVPELAAETAGWGFGTVPTAQASSDLGKPSPADSKVLLIDGKRGKVLWSKNAERLQLLGNVDRRPGAEVMVGSELSQKSSFGFTVGAYTATGKRVWSTTRSVRLGNKEFPAYHGFNALADTNGDGVAEIGYAILTQSARKTRRDEGTIDGRTGRVRKDPRPSMRATRAALDGRGADAYLAAGSQSRLRIEAYRGDAPQRLWTSEVAANAPMVFGSTPVSVDGDKCGDMVVAAAGFDDSYTDVVFSGSTGKALWALTRSDFDPGVVRKPAVKTHKVYRKGC